MNEFINFRSFIIPKEYEVEFFNSVVSIYCYFPVTFLFFCFFSNAFYGKFHVKKFTYLNLPGKLGWFIMELVSPATFLYSFLAPSPFIDHNNESLITSPYNTTQKILASLYLIHYFNRTVVYTYRAPSISPIHLLVFFSSIIFNLINGYSNGRWISVFGNYSEEKCKEPLFIIGVIIYFIGMWINIEHDNILFEMRKKNSSSKKSEKSSKIDDNSVNDKKKYFIPNEGLFNYISCPNYLGETIEWIGFAIACWYDLPALLFALATPANLFPRARQTLKWYRENFKEYPKERKAIIPFVW
ncbi:3-oxo-5-alpha-steroid 4-dehydrogenase-domain-containing protein [Glomus cerebriforme]|uniref:3-oxo-5-alpha-steroid 4-dehydrogenase-domain-containing protein n=1 Tax=Glomus cerebriforme TaxID=658196 RepID=A0A397SUQ5_9GLOM|nr:3-oxo-5-alpha-steroid 4-dehydrogenase-domain-containing protein [Glomus cerebriforme]